MEIGQLGGSNGAEEHRLVLAVDPGSERSAFVIWNGSFIVDRDIVANAELRDRLSTMGRSIWTLVVEMVACYGMPVGASVFETCVWIGRFLEAWRWESDRVFRKDVKIHLCGSMRAKDSNIRQAILDRFGGRDRAIGGKKCQTCKGKGWAGRGRPECRDCSGNGWYFPPGPLHGVRADEWSALAVALTWHDRLIQPAMGPTGSRS